MLQCWALELGCYIVSSVLGGQNIVVNPLGQILHRSSLHEPIIAQKILTDYIVCHIDGHKEKVQRIKVEYGLDITVEVATSEARYLIASNHPKIKIGELAQKFQLESYWQYCQRAEQMLHQPR